MWKIDHLKALGRFCKFIADKVSIFHDYYDNLSDKNEDKNFYKVYINIFKINNTDACAHTTYIYNV